MTYKQKVIIGDAVLYLGDCMDVLPALDKVDAVVTDPPYELSDSGPGKSHYGMSLNKFDGDDYKNIVNGFDFESVFYQLRELCKPFNAFCFCSNKQISKLMQVNELAGFATTLLIWHKTNSAPFANGVWRGDIEYCIHARGRGAYFQGNAKQKEKVSSFPIVVDSAHPTVKPLELIRKYLEICTDVNHSVIDPFMGSGTTGVAATQLGRKFIGIEREPKYFDIACQRIEQAAAQGRLFEPVRAKQVQEVML